MKKIVGAAMLSVLIGSMLAACASDRAWVHPRKNDGDLNKDRQACLAAAEVDAYGQKVVNTRIFDRCLEERGWKRQ